MAFTIIFTFSAISKEKSLSKSTVGDWFLFWSLVRVPGRNYSGDFSSVCLLGLLFAASVISLYQTTSQKNGIDMRALEICLYWYLKFRCPTSQKKMSIFLHSWNSLPFSIGSNTKYKGTNVVQCYSNTFWSRQHLNGKKKPKAHLKIIFTSIINILSKHMTEK